MSDTEKKEKTKKKLSKFSGEASQARLTLAMHWIFFGLIIAMVVTGFILYFRMNDSLNTFAAKQLARVARSNAEVISEETVTALENLEFLAAQLEAQPESQQELLSSTAKVVHTEKFGCIGVDGTPVFGRGLPDNDMTLVKDALHGTGSLVYREGVGLVAACPVMRQKNIRYVLYEIIPNDRIAEVIENSEESPLGYQMVMNKEGTTAYVFEGIPEAGAAFLQSSEADGYFQDMFRTMELNHAACDFYSAKTVGDIFVYEAEIPQTDFFLAGYAEKDAVAADLDRIAFLVMWVFGLLAVIFVISAIYLVRVQVRVTKVNEIMMEKNRAEVESNSKSSFLASMSHEIRTPINAVLGIDEMILREFDDPKLTGYATNIKNAGNTLLNIVNDVLDYSKMESGKLSIVPVDYDLSELIIELVTMVRPRATAKSLNFVVNVDETMPHILHGDNVRVKQCALNILTNAIKYTERGQVVFTVSYRAGEEGLGAFTFQVQDTGIGIKPEDMDRLYKPFERLDEEKNHGIEGTGLGLSITTRLLALMGTKLFVSSVYGEGSTFGFTIDQFVLDEEPIGDVRATYKKKIETAPVYHQAFTAPDAKILVVDDTDMNLFVVKGLLKETKISVDTAMSGEQGLAKLKVYDYDIVLIDHKMPGMDGIEMLHRLRRESMNPNQHKPCIALTANAMSGARDYYISEGFEDYLSKPIDSAALEKMLMDFLPAEKIRIEKQPELPDPELAKAVAMLKDRRNRFMAG